ncbi:amidohydrolase family protein [Lutimonas halocynthiae]|uniref:metal-dependent hydrolase family protein n=1 Tax=Lutimonas halocynthiae TaxID=1446477 RepID=UPI0025B2DE3F|nr:amidohydrolase family protein [Lutimonas halocynthiae]MDN3643047.1 amidohydrolase family protein [Lutimonas halocynthiae]
MKKLLRTILLVSFLLSVSHGITAQEDEKTIILITNVKVWDGLSDKTISSDVLIENNKFKEIKSNIKAPSGATVIDGQGGTLIPGLIDMHMHLMLWGGTTEGTYNYDAYAQGARAKVMMDRLINMGYTTVRDIGGNSLSIAKLIQEGKLDGPRIYSSGPVISQTGGHGDWGPANEGPGEGNYQTMTQNTHVVDGVPEVLKATRWNFRNGANFIKVMAGGGVASTFDPLNMTQMNLDELKAIVEVANAYESYVAVHSYHDRSYNMALDAGVKSFEHGFLITEPTVKRMSETEGVFWSWQPFGSYTLFAGGFPEWFTADMREKGAAVNKGAVIVPPLMRKYGVTVVLGSDMFGDEVKFARTNIVSAKEVPNTGYTDLEIMKMATSNCGKILTMSGPGRDPYKEAKLGVVEVGAWADLNIWNADPTKDVKVLASDDNLLLVMKDGKVYKSNLK